MAQLIPNPKYVAFKIGDVMEQCVFETATALVEYSVRELIKETCDPETSAEYLRELANSIDVELSQ